MIDFWNSSRCSSSVSPMSRAWRLSKARKTVLRWLKNTSLDSLAIIKKGVELSFIPLQARSMSVEGTLVVPSHTSIVFALPALPSGTYNPTANSSGSCSKIIKLIRQIDLVIYHVRCLRGKGSKEERLQLEPVLTKLLWSGVVPSSCLALEMMPESPDHALLQITLLLLDDCFVVISMS